MSRNVKRRSKSHSHSKVKLGSKPNSLSKEEIEEIMCQVRQAYYYKEDMEYDPILFRNIQDMRGMEVGKKPLLAYLFKQPSMDDLIICLKEFEKANIHEASLLVTPLDRLCPGTTHSAFVFIVRRGDCSNRSGVTSFT